jgi:hypothetical protein
MRRLLLWIAIPVLLFLGYIFLRSGSPRLNVEPNAAEEIEKAKRR